MSENSPAPTSQRVQQGLAAAARPLGAADRERFEARFQWSFADVRVHAGPEAERTASGLGARAFTVGRDIVMGREDDTGSREELLAHELAHVVQAGGAAHAGAVRLADPHGKAEREAEDAATRVAAGGRAGMLPPAEPRVHRAPITMPQVKKQIIAKGRDDISELARALPDSFGGGAVKVREATVGTTKHVFQLVLNVMQGSPGPFGSSNASTGEAVKTTGTGASQKTTHTFVISMFSNVSGDAVETLFHELIHARILMDRSLPEGERGDTYRRYAQLVELSTGPMAIVTGTEPKRDAVLEGIARIRTAAKRVPGFDEKQLDSRYDAENIYEFLINEKFANQDSAAAFGKSIDNTKVASRYSPSVRDSFVKAIQKQGLWPRYTTAPGNGKSPQDFMEDAEGTLRKALVALYNALDEQKKQIEDMKKPAGSGASPTGKDDMLFNPTFLPGTGFKPAPLDLEGKPVGTAP